jgi:hypothetical protein
MKYVCVHGQPSRTTLVLTSNDCPPIPTRRLDWSAVTDDYEPGDPMGNGATELEAINDLLDQLEEDA